MDRSPVSCRALITGASAGIGAVFARMLAARGHDLVLTARRQERLQALADELRRAHGVTVTTVCQDLSQPGAVTALTEALKRQQLAIDLLINNAGYGLTGEFLSRPWHEHADFLRVMLEVPAELAHALLPGMRERGHGGIINVASLAGLLPGSRGHTLYAAVKSCLISFTQSLALESRDHGIRVSALCPGFTYSEFHDVNGTRPLVSKMPKFMWMDAERVVREGLQALEKGRVVYVPGRINRLIKTVAEIMPDRWVLRLTARQSHAFRKLNAN